MKSKAKTEEYSSEGSLEDAYVDGRINEEPPMYDDLLKALFPNSPSVSHVHKKRQREHEGLNSMDYEDSTSGISEGEEFNEGGVSNFSPNKFNLLKRKHPHVVEDKDLETINPHEVSDSDQEEDAERDIIEFTDELSRGRSFHDHFGIHKKLEIDVLMKKIQKFKWEMSAVDSSTSKWLGTGECFLKDIGDDVQYGLPVRLYNHWLKEYEASGGNDFHVSRQREFFLLFNSYRDIMHCNKKPFYLTGIQEDSSITDAYIIHAVNHVFRTRNLVIKNDARLAKDQDNSKEKLLCGNDFRDQGFTRPKVLFLLPYRSLALRLVKRLIRLTPLSKKGNVEHLRRFFDEFGTDDDAKAAVPNSALEAAGAKHRTLKPKDHEVLFGGNNDDCFMIGIKFNKWSIKLYADFYSCDMIVASPLGVSKKIAETTKEKGKDVDYLSSIEVLVIDHADVIAMQNWSHLTTVVEQLNHLPSKQRRTDFMRVRQWYLDGQARFYRQTILLSSFLNPDMSSLFSHLCVNHEGKVKLTCTHKGILPKVSLSVKQVYERFDPNSIDDIDDARFHCFVKNVFPKIKDSIQGGIMIFVSSYLDFVRVRNFLKSQGASFCLLGEYTKQSDISRARVWFFQGTRKIMLYTERAHFYHRYKIRGIQNLFIYSLPERKDFYPEMLNMLDESKNMTCTVIFSRFDHLKLERIVGTAASKRMTSSKQGMFVFC